MWQMGREALGPRTSKCHKENVSYFNKDLEGPQIRENGPGSLKPKDENISHLTQIEENEPRGLGPQNEQI